VRGTGLGICTKYVLKTSRLSNFGGASVGWDRLARKGVLYAQLVLEEGLLVDIVTTHMQAGHAAHAVNARMGQLEELVPLLAAVGSKDRALIVCGDFNIDGLGAARELAPYRRLAAVLDGFEDLGAVADLPTFEPNHNALANQFEPGGSAQRIDYIFWRPALDQRVTHLRTERFFAQPTAAAHAHHDPRAWASDHSGLLATFQLT
jgi:endonuclease/exonuclease/phosphatase family metal-dependent hydrolase